MSHTELVKFRLYVAEGAPNSRQARSNLLALCRQHLPDNHEIEIVDVFKEPQRALQDGIFMTPTLMRMSPLPQRRVVGTLSHLPKVLQALELDGDFV